MEDFHKAALLRGTGIGEKTVVIEGQQALLVKGTCRSGTKIHHPGNVVVAGDVNSGAEITATKDIMVFGRLAGLAHAGVDGAEDAVIIALQIEAPQLRIGPHIKMDPPVGRGKRSTKMPDIALVREEAIVVEPFVARSVWDQEE
ncbi:MAG: septum site-determining protein MinC [Dehalococcoidia bacterium]